MNTEKYEKRTNTEAEALGFRLIHLAVEVVKSESEDIKNVFLSSFHAVVEKINIILDQIKSSKQSKKLKRPDWRRGGATTKLITYEVIQSILQEPDLINRLSGLSKLIKTGLSQNDKRIILKYTLCILGSCAVIAGAIAGTVISFGTLAPGIAGFIAFVTAGIGLTWLGNLLSPEFRKEFNMIGEKVQTSQKMKERMERLAILNSDIIESLMSETFANQTAHFTILVRLAYGIEETPTQNFIQNIINELNYEQGDNNEYLKRIVYFDQNKSYKDLFNNPRQRFPFSIYNYDDNFTDYRSITLAEAYVIASEYQTALSRIDLRGIEGIDNIKEEINKIIVDYYIKIPKFAKHTKSVFSCIQTLREMQPQPFPNIDAISFFDKYGFLTVYKTYEATLTNTEATPQRDDVE